MSVLSVKNWEVKGNELIISTQDSVIGLSFVDPKMIRLRFNQGDVFLEEETFVVVQHPICLPFDLQETENYLRIVSGALCLEIDFSPLMLRILHDGGGTVLETTIPNMAEVNIRFHHNSFFSRTG